MAGKADEASFDADVNRSLGTGSSETGTASAGKGGYVPDDPSLFVEKSRLRSQVTQLKWRVKRLPKEMDEEKIGLHSRLDDFVAKLSTSRSPAKEMLDTIRSELNGEVIPDISALEASAAEAGLMPQPGTTALARPTNGGKPIPRFIGATNVGTMNEEEWKDFMRSVSPLTVQSLVAAANPNGAAGGFSEKALDRMFDMQTKYLDQRFRDVQGAFDWDPWRGIKQMRDAGLNVVVGGGGSGGPADIGVEKLRGTYQLLGKGMDNLGATRREVVTLLKPLVTSHYKSYLRDMDGNVPPQVPEWTEEELRHLNEEQEEAERRESEHDRREGQGDGSDEHDHEAPRGGGRRH